MAIERILASALGGAIGGGLGGLISLAVARRWKRSTKPATLVVVPAIVCGMLVASFEAPRDRPPPSRVERASAMYMGDLMRTEAAKRRFTSPDDARAAGAALTHAGLKRLTRADLDEWNRVRLVLAERSPAICSGLWTGKQDPKVLVATLEQLSDADLDAWARVSADAVRAELDGTGAVALPDGALERSVQSIAARLPAADADRFRRDLAAGLGLDDAESCWAMRTMLAAVVGLAPAEREVALRALAAL